MLNKLKLIPAAALLAAAFALPSAHGQGKQEVGISGKEILLGHIGPYSGPASAYGTIGRAISEIGRAHV